MSMIDRKAAILEAFVKLVRRYGLDKTTMHDVAKEVGISVGVIYKDFQNKEELISAYVDSILNQLLNECHRIVEQNKPSEELLHDLIIGYFKIIERLLNKDHAFHQLVSDDDAIRFYSKAKCSKNKMKAELSVLVKKVMERGVADQIFQIDDVEETAELFFSAFHRFIIELTLEKQSFESISSGVEHMYRFIIRAILK